jgi:hypothetical protein
MHRISDEKAQDLYDTMSWAPREITEEMMRARSEEARLTEQAEALSDALEAVWRRGLASPGVYAQCEAILRKIGRIP